MQLNKTAKILIASGVTLLTGALFFGRKAKAKSLNQYNTQANSNATHSVIITNHDNVYDYKYETGIWFTKRKGSSDWINMQAALSPENYQIAASRLQKNIQS